jgi:hypothetical protein
MNPAAAVDAILEGEPSMVDHSQPCPHLDRNDQRCACHFRLGRLSEVFQVCCDEFHGCLLYHRLNQESAAAGVSRGTDSTTELTIHGRTEQLRTTGS